MENDAVNHAFLRKKKAHTTIGNESTPTPQSATNQLAHNHQQRFNSHTTIENDAEKPRVPPKTKKAHTTIGNESTRTQQSATIQLAHNHQQRFNSHTTMDNDAQKPRVTPKTKKG